MNRLLFLMLLLLSGMKAFSQDNPYAVFGYETHMRYESAEADFFAIENKDTTGEVRKLMFCFDRQQINLIGSDGTVLDVVRIRPHLTLRFISPDPKERDYPALSPYNFVANMPLRAVDPDGREIYILFTTTGNSRGDAMFSGAAQTRKDNIQNSQFFDPSRDKVVVLQVSDISDIHNQVNNIVAQYSAQYGKTREVGIWSHGGFDGPIGTEQSFINPLYREGEVFRGELKNNTSSQMSLLGWSQIDFNWSENGASCTFYGCNTGNDIDLKRGWVGSFALNISGLDNFRDVQVAGQSTSAYPSFSPLIRTTNLARAAYPSVGFSTGETYLVGGNGSEGRQAMWFTPDENPVANRFQINMNGSTKSDGFQSKESFNPIIK